MHYRKIWESYHNESIPEKYEIHHVDGNRNNNHPDNLLCVSIEEHLKIHKTQEDWGAVQAILARMENRDGIIEAARNFQLQKLQENTHNFQRMSKKRRTEISKKTMKKRLKIEGVAFLGIDDVKLNSKKAGLVAAQKKSGFLNPDTDKHGSNYVKDTFWWTNVETGVRIRSKFAPNEKWKKGMKL